ncbi:MAG: hypothetical protein KDI06_13525 [Calditrichaeota bacterium]|nr:hypothetical protein [Calditrichota bacterium]HQU73057.1 hypothetical protein [Calditrichia bacterium]
MKSILYLLAALALLGCNQDKISKLEQENQSLQSDMALLQEEVQLKEDYIQEYTSTINAVYDNLENIRKREGFLAKYSENEGENKVSLQKKMISNIASIDEALQKSRKSLRNLQDKSATFKNKSEALEQTVENLTRAIEEKEKELEQHRADLEDLNRRFTDAETRLASQDELIANQSNRLNTAYYIIGSEKELKEKGIITEEGGFLGLRKTKKLADNFPEEEFVRADIEATDVISIDRNIDGVRLISPHHTDSFHLQQTDDNQTSLEIIDPKEFWKMKYLVILTKG